MPAYIPPAARNDWRTPPDVIGLVRQAFDGEITLDPCAGEDLRHGQLHARRNFQYVPREPGLNRMLWEESHDRGACEACPADWVDIIQTYDGCEELWGGKVFVNPPYNENRRWIEKCAATAENPLNEVIALIPARTDTRYWQDVIAKTAAAVCFWRGRMRFYTMPPLSERPDRPPIPLVPAPASAPFPVALVYWGGPFGVQRFYDTFKDRGHLVTPAVR